MSLTLRTEIGRSLALYCTFQISVPVTQLAHMISLEDNGKNQPVTANTVSFFVQCPGSSADFPAWPQPQECDHCRPGSGSR